MPEPSPLAVEFAAAGATVHVIPMRRITTSGNARYWLEYVLRWPVSVWRIWSLARSIDAGVLHSNSLHSWYAWPVARLRRTPLVWHAREIVVQSTVALSFERWLTKHFAWKVIAVSEPVAAQLPEADVVVVHDVPDSKEFSPSHAGRFRRSVGISDDAVLVGAAGRIDTWKGFDVLLDAADAIRESRPDVEIAIVGGPVVGKEDYASALSRRADAIDGVHWFGPRTDMPEMLADLDVFVLASTSPEPFSTVLAEALASGVPAVGTDHGGTPEMLSEAPPGRGVLIAPNDPGALADGVLSLLDEGPSSSARRQGRSAVTLATSTTFAEVFDAARLARRVR